MPPSGPVQICERIPQPKHESALAAAQVTHRGGSGAARPCCPDFSIANPIVIACTLDEDVFLSP
jgi:hypothetical protein